MVNQQIYDFFKNAYSRRTQINGPRGWLMQKDWDTQLFPLAGINQVLRINYRIPVEEDIIFKRDTSFWSNNNQGIVITDVSIYVHLDSNDPENFFYLDWSNISSIKYKDSVYYFYGNDNELLATLGDGMFFKGSFDETQKSNLALFLTEAASLVEKPIDPFDEIYKLEDDKQYDEAILAMESLLGDYDQNPWAHLTYVRIATKKILSIGQPPDENTYNLIQDHLNKSVRLADDENFTHIFPIASYWRGYNHYFVGHDYNARNDFINALEAESDEIKDDAKSMLGKCEEDLKGLWDNFLTSFEYNDRKYIMPIRDHQIAGCISPGISIFRMSNIPSCIKFPIGHPVANELYIGHPYNSELYVPYEGHEDIFFIDKINELSYILQCLGAEEISITAIKGKTVNEIEKSSSSLGGNVDFAVISGSADVNSNANHRQSTQSNIERTLVQKFDPLKKPFVPEGLIWYPEQPKWQRLVESRLSGNLLEYNEFVSTSDTSFTSTTETDEIKASVQYLWNKLDVNVSSRIEKEFEQKIETQWRVDVKFRSMLEFDQQVSNTPKALTANEQKYLDLVQKSCVNGEISNLNRKMLERIRIKLGISEERASDLETSLIPQLSEEEMEYLDAVREYLANGTIGENEREMLKTLCELNNISEERAQELEAMA